MLIRSILALIITFAAAVLWLRVMDFIAHRGWISSRLSRKLIHIGTGPLFVICWLLFPGAWYDRFLAALVPGLITLQFALVGLGIVQDQAAVQAMSRTGDPREILRGPLYYGIIFVVLTIAYWLDSPIGIIVLMLICGGDGLADIVGRRFGTYKLPWSREKSWIGSLGFLAGAWLLALLVLGVYLAAGVFEGTLSDYLVPLTIISLGTTLVEALSPPDTDNLTIAVAGVVLGHLLI